MAASQPGLSRSPDAPTVPVPHYSRRYRGIWGGHVVWSLGQGSRLPWHRLRANQYRGRDVQNGVSADNEIERESFAL